MIYVLIKKLFLSLIISCIMLIMICFSLFGEKPVIFFLKIDTIPEEFENLGLFYKK